MKKILTHLSSSAVLAIGFLFLAQSSFAACTGAGAPPVSSMPACSSVDVGALGFKIPSLGDILTFAIRAFFAIAGISALFYMILGAFGWITSGGDKDAITAAREKIQAAVVGMILVVGVLAVIWTLEQVIFKRRVCLGLSCPVTLPGLIQTTSGAEFCCVCTKPAGGMGIAVDAYTHKCDPSGTTSTAL